MIARLLCPAFLLLPACDGRSGVTEEAGSRLPLDISDSSGVEIARIGADPWTAPEFGSIQRDRALRIVPDESRPHTLFTRVRGARRLSDGRVAVLDAASLEVRLFDSSFRYLGSIGRGGQGPGELESPWRLMRGRADSLVVYDFNETIEIFSPDGSGDSARQVRLPWASTGGTAQILDVFPDGSYLGILNEFMGALQEGRNPLYSSMHVMQPDGTAGVEMGRHVSVEMVFRKESGGLQQLAPLFWAEPGMAGLSHGYAWCHTARFECEIWSADSGLIRLVRAEPERERVTDAHVDSVIRLRLMNLRTEADSVQTRKRVLEGDRPEFFPVLSLIRSDSRDRIWLREFAWDVFEGDVRWLVFEPGGAVQGVINLPARLQVWDIGADYVLGVETDSLDVATVVLYPLASR